MAWAAEGRHEPPSTYPTAPPQSYLHPSSEWWAEGALGSPCGPQASTVASFPRSPGFAWPSAILPAPESRWHRKSKEEVEWPGREGRGC